MDYYDYICGRNRKTDLIMNHWNTLRTALSLALTVGTLCCAPLSARTFCIAPTGDDAAAGTVAAPWASLARAQRTVQPGDTVYIRGGRYAPTTADVMAHQGNYALVYALHTSGAGPDARIAYIAYPGDERPVFDCTMVRPEGYRVSAFHVEADWLYLYGFDVVGVQVVVRGHTQSECISVNGSHNVFEHLAMHDGMAIGYYQTGGADNLVLNCDAYCNYDPYSEGPYGGNVDGFGGHVREADGGLGNVFRGCRAWWNSDDGFDLINAQAAYTIEDCWSFYNGYQPRSFDRAGDGTGFKAGGYGMRPDLRRVPRVVPRHRVVGCIAYRNKNKGFYANHHLGGIDWHHNTAYRNPVNYSMLNRIAAAVARDTTGYGHTLWCNLSVGTAAERHLDAIDEGRSTLWNNVFGTETEADGDAFVTLDPEGLMAPRRPDGSLPELDFLRLRPGTPLYRRGVGFQFE